MERIKGLSQYINSKTFREGGGLPLEGELDIKLLAQGEYNINYVFTHPLTLKKLILRVNTKSQMKLDNQIEYEYKAIKELASSGRVPAVYYVDKAPRGMDFGILVMEFLEGTPLDYKKDLSIAAECLADIHSVDIKPLSHLISPSNPFKAMIEECTEMSSFYLNSSLGDEKVKIQIKRLLEKAKDLVKDEKDFSGTRHCINTELNSGNFLINGEGKKNYIIDWEKPILGEVAQDLGHFLAPTTTFWKTDVILKRSEIDEFINEYIKAVDNRFSTLGLAERVNIYLILTCLRGITWCAMAWVEYQDPNRIIKNEFTYEKIKTYLTLEFLNSIEKEYF